MENVKRLREFRNLGLDKRTKVINLCIACFVILLLT